MGSSSCLILKGVIVSKINMQATSNTLGANAGGVRLCEIFIGATNSKRARGRRQDIII